MPSVLHKARQGLRVLSTGSSFLFFWGGGAVTSQALIPLVLRLPMDERRRKRLCQQMVRTGFTLFHDYMRTMGLVLYDPRETAVDLPAGPYVLIANHPTLVDVTAIVAANPELSCVVKEELFEGPFVGRLLEVCGHINGGDGSPLSLGAVVHQAMDRLAGGQPVLIFPEGTRSPELSLGPFFRGAFEIAKRAKVPVVPLVVTCNPPTLMKGQRWYEVPHRGANLVIDQPFGWISPEELEGSSKVLAAKYQKLYEERLGSYWERAAEELAAVRRDMETTHG